MRFDECIQSVHKGSVISFKEYTLNRHERKVLTLEINDGVVQEVFPANMKLNRETLEKYYGDGLDEIDYLQLSQVNCPRIVVGLGLNQNNEMDVKILILNKDFYNMGLQELEVTNEVNISNEPNFFQFQSF